MNSQPSSFNTQPPEGGWVDAATIQSSLMMFQHTAARRRLGQRAVGHRYVDGFQHTAARRRLDSSFGKGKTN